MTPYLSGRNNTNNSGFLIRHLRGKKWHNIFQMLEKKLSTHNPAEFVTSRLMLKECSLNKVNDKGRHFRTSGREKNIQ